MAETTLIKKDIEIHPKYLNSDVKTHIKDILEKTKICTKKYGYIVKINEIVNIYSLPISTVTKFPVFSIVFSADTILPKPDKILECKINMVSQQGLIMKYGSMNIFLPYTNLKEYTYNKEDKTFTKGKKVIKADDNIKVKLTVVKYEKQVFNCICTLA